jgi:diacylglycerol kinase family enzyme
MREVAFVINPATVPHIDRLERRCREAAASYAWAPVFIRAGVTDDADRLDHRLVEYAMAGTETLVFAIGGDGTVRACAHALAHTGTPLAVVPRGTANLFARALGVGADLDRALSVGFEGENHRVDLGVAGDTAGDATFTAMAGMGTDAAVVASTPRFLKDHFGWAGYALSALPQIVHPAHEVMVSIEGAEPFPTLAQSVVVGNVGIMPGGFGIFPEARMDDGLLDVGVLSPKSILGWALMARTVLAKGHFADRHFAHYQGRSVEVTARDPLPRQLDGDAIGPSRTLSLRADHKALVARAPRP